MTVYVYEHLSATTPPGENPFLEVEGWAMLDRLARDLAAASAGDVEALLHPKRMDADLSPAKNRAWPIDTSPDQVIADLDADALWYVVAPEGQGLLADLVQTLTKLGRRQAGLSLKWIHACGDKLATFEQFGPPVVPTADRVEVLAGNGPVVIKPRDGCGSAHVLAVDRRQAPAGVEQIRQAGYSGDLVFQPLIEGTPASVALIGMGSAGITVLPTVVQEMHREKAAVGEEFLYRGGRLSPDLPASNVPDVVAAICRLLGPFSGYIGFDLVIDGRGQAHVVEINPRLTTSYVGYSAWLRKEAGEQAGLGRWMLGEHRELPQLTRTFRFTTNGDVTIA